MKAVVCGDRYWTNRELVRAWLSKLQGFGVDTIIQGEAPGADTIAKEEVKMMGFQVSGVDVYPQGFHAEWGKYRLAAGPIRNRQMLDELQPGDLVVAFHDDLSKSKGTKDTVTEARKRGFWTYVVGRNGVTVR